MTSSKWDYLEYRKGPRTRPKPRHVRIYDGQQREHIVHRLFEVMRGWNLTPFELEDTMRASVRGTLCLAGHGWDQADQESAGLVAETLGRLRAVRPTWEQGQPEYSIPKENCNRCGGAIPEDLQIGGRHHRFCSDVRARAAIEKRDYEGLRMGSAAYRAALDIIQLAKSPLTQCKHCQKDYRPVLGKPSVYCSRECTAAARVVVPGRICRACSTTFHPPQGNRQEAGFCYSRACDMAYRQTLRFDKICACCGGAFVAKHKKAMFCSTARSQVVSHFRTGKGIPKTIQPHVFDYVFRMAA